MKDIFTYGITLMLICALAAAALAFTYEKTQKVIELNEAREKEKALKEILSSAKRFVKLENNITPKDPLVNIQEVYIGYDDGEKVGSIWEVSTKGYSSEIKLLVGVDKNNKILEVRVMSQEETPGLGAEVTKEGFLKQFLGKNEPNLEVKRNINPVTGATISSRAVVRAINEVLNHTNFEGGG
ncbi:MAG TPA: RnfABCDGE type electron transport complex subunit G [Dictyoglomaceae bacterium]|nr:RnfABCDGE type electron transport complex subunit G [Dictyoglomaceae bacterium]HOL38726.1 RnfABCDGE type electron transport complex subunit G [Dictyoglomaceae bacterium]HOP94570.1 RnfABCDGE type electron transport complex subunit G [Dictyoglomaceae bacterium]HPP15525.1 RnfABCDGE type electron transport complex subunit G [Dictyoglomaceae bacterium]HPU42840.1 RnfABCDGE type electron transport complex subunit G [Dictyoglomaceae bacterium]